MPLEALGREEKLNIKKVEASDEQIQERFDVNEEMTPEVWDKMMKIVQPDEKDMVFRLAGEANKRYNSAVVYGLLVQLFPERSREMATIATEVSLKKQIEEGIRNTDYDSALRDAYLAHIVFPETPMEEFGITEEFLKTIFSYIKETLREGEFWGSLRIEMYFLINIFPDLKKRFQSEGLLDETKYDKIRTALPVDFEDEFGFGKSLEAAAQFRVLFPERFTEADYPWNNFAEVRQRIVEIEAGGNYQFLANILFNLRVITADKITLTGRGISFEDLPKTKYQSETLPIPELKK